MEWKIVLHSPLEFFLLALAGMVIAAIVLFVLVCAWKLLARVAKYARKPLRRCVRAVLWALARAVARVVGVVAVAVFYPPSAMAKAIKTGEKEGGGRMFRILFGAGLILAAIGAFATVWIFVRR